VKLVHLIYVGDILIVFDNSTISTDMYDEFNNIDTNMPYALRENTVIK